MSFSVSANPNNFATQLDCDDYCGVGGCPDGGEPYKENQGQYRVCGQGIHCPLTHFCTQVTFGTTTPFNYCCPTKGVRISAKFIFNELSSS